MFVGPVNSARDPLESIVHRLFCKSRDSWFRAQCMRPIDKHDETLLSIKKKLKTQMPKHSRYPNIALISTIK